MPSGENNAAKTHCPQGHPLSGDNLLAADLKRGKRSCKACHREHARAYQLRKKQEARHDS